MTPRCPVNCLIVEIDKAYEDEIVFPSGVKLFKDTQEAPEWNTTCTGCVVATPTYVRKYNDNGSEKPEYRGLLLDAKDGDVVIFDYTVIEDKELRERDTPLHNNRFFINGNWLWKVDYMHVLGYVRNGEPVPSSKYVFLKDAVKTEEMAGSFYLPEMAKRTKRGNRAEVIAGAGLEAGTVIVYNDRYAQRYTVKGKEIIVLPREYLAAIE